VRTGNIANPPFLIFPRRTTPLGAHDRRRFVGIDEPVRDCGNGARPLRGRVQREAGLGLRPRRRPGPAPRRAAPSEPFLLLHSGRRAFHEMYELVALDTKLPGHRRQVLGPTVGLGVAHEC